jgi:hypothetical protein
VGVGRGRARLDVVWRGREVSTMGIDGNGRNGRRPRREGEALSRPRFLKAEHRACGRLQ